VTISVCLPIRNGAATLERFLLSFRPWVDELCFLDTGSTDRTLEILAEHAERPGAPIIVGHAEWRDDYALAFNQAAELASCDYVLASEDDEVLHGGDHLRRLLAEAMPGGAMIRCIEVKGADLVAFRFVLRVSRRGLGRWEGRVHQALDLPDDAPIEVFSPDLVWIAHHKQPSTLRHDHRPLVEMALAREPSRLSRFFYGRHLLEEEQDYSAAAALFERVVDESEPWQRNELHTVQRSFELLAQIRATLVDPRGAREAIDGRRRVREQIKRDPIFRQCDAFDELHQCAGDHPVWRLIDEALS
jgi:glycosyltransferase involved in cell wall biosynthesis